MSSTAKQIFKNYSSIIYLLAGIITGSIAGIIFGKSIEVLKPLGDIFLNLIFTAIIPLIFFAISSAVANIERSGSFGKLISNMFFVYIGTTIVAAILAIVAVKLFPLENSFSLQVPPQLDNNSPLGNQITSFFTVGEFGELLSRKHMLALILISILVGVATMNAGHKGENFKQFLNAGSEVFKKLITLIMKAAPIGLGAYFGYLVGTYGPELFGAYAHSLVLYTGFSMVYFFVMFSVYAWLAGGFVAIKRYWINNIIPSLTALGTCSSLATLPANMEAGEKMGIKKVISDLTMPLGASLHKDGSSISTVLEIAIAFAIFSRPVEGINTYMIILGISVLGGIITGGIPNGGYIKEMMIVSFFNLPIEVLSVLIVFGTLIDPIATLLNATGDTVASMLIARLTEGKDWLKGKKSVHNPEFQNI